MKKKHIKYITISKIFNNKISFFSSLVLELIFFFELKSSKILAIIFAKGFIKKGVRIGINK